MNHSSHNKLVSFIWSIADDCLRDVYVRGKYRDIILPFVVLRRIDSLLEPTKEAVLEEVHFQREDLGQVELDAKGLESASKYVFYNTSTWTMEKLKGTATNSQQKLVANFEEYLNGFSANVKEIIEKFNLTAQIRHMASKDVLLDVLEKFTSPYINLTPLEKNDPEGRPMPALTNLGMGYVFEELIRKFNEENNEEAGEHFTPREVIQLMTTLVFEPLKNQLPNIITIYDPACGSGGMLTESENYLVEESAIQYGGDVYLYGKEINDETYAICKSDMMIKGKDPENIRVGSTLSTNEFSQMKFDFMLSNPPYGKSWASEQKYIKDGKEVIDSRFQIKLKDYWGNWETVDATPRSSDGQLLFLMEMVDKMKAPTANKIGSRIASVHNGSSLFTGDAGSGESNIRRYIIENDLLDAIVQLPNNLFYNTGITTYIWLLNNNKAANRKGFVQLLDANNLYRKLRKNLGNKNSEFSPEQIAQIAQAYLDNKTESGSEDELKVKQFRNADFGYYKVSIERPKRLKAQFTKEALDALRFDKSLAKPMQAVYETYGDFDQPKLTTMYVDKKLQGVLCVQALSRLNRAANKLKKRTESLFVLDFFNDSSDIKTSFDPFYTSTSLSSATDVNVLHDLKDSLDDSGIYEWSEVEEFNTLFFRGESADDLSPIIGKAEDRFNQDLDLTEDVKADLKIKAKHFVKVYGQLAAIISFENMNWEKLYWFLKFLIPKMIVKKAEADLLDELLNSVDLSTYGIERVRLNETLELDKEESQLTPPNSNPRGAHTTDENSLLEDIIKDFNSRWFADWDATEEDKRLFFKTFVEKIQQHPDYQSKYLNNQDAYTRDLAYDKIMEQVALSMRKLQLDFAKQWMDDHFKQDFKSGTQRALR